MSDELARRLVPDRLWQIAEPLIPPHRLRPQGGGRSRADDRAVFTAITFVLISSSPWRSLPSVFGVTAPTAHRRFKEWAASGIWHRLHEQSALEFGDSEETAWTGALLESVEARTRQDHLLQAATGRAPDDGRRRDVTAGLGVSACSEAVPAAGTVVISLRSGAGQGELVK